MEEILKYRREVDWPQVLESVKGLIQEIPEAYRNARRKEYLRIQIGVTKIRFFKACREFATRKDDFTYWSVKHAERLERKLGKLSMDVKILLGKEGGISPELIVRARSYPIESLLPSRNGMASCPFHRDRHPSMDIRKNFYYCYSCGANGDVIDLVMRLNNISFVQ